MTSDKFFLIVVAPFRSCQVGGEGISAEKRLRLENYIYRVAWGLVKILLLIQFIEKHAGVVVI